MSSSLLLTCPCLSLAGALLALCSSSTQEAEQLPMDFGHCGELCACCQGSGSPLDSQGSPKPCSNPCAHPVPSTARTGARSSPEDPVHPTPPPQLSCNRALSPVVGIWYL